MNYSDAIEWLREHDVKKDDGTFYQFGEVLTCCSQTHQQGAAPSGLLNHDCRSVHLLL